jgi:large subunit ribosomal protein L15
MRLHTLKPRPGAKKSRKRIGRGNGSGHGKTAGRGMKGQGSRSGSSTRPGFEGGQLPLIRRIPKRGFNNARFTTYYLPVNLGDLEQFEDGATVDEAVLRGAGLANGKSDGIKILAQGELNKKLTVRASAFSASARKRIEELGGACEVVDKKVAKAADQESAGE